ncbi:MAG: hypothetical protein ACO3CL_08405 [Bacteroidia bacterium]
MKWALALTLMFLLLFGPWIVFVPERTRNKWLRPVAYFCMFLGPALVALGGVNFFLSKKKGITMAEAPGSSEESKKTAVNIRAGPAKEKSIVMSTKSNNDCTYDFPGKNRTANVETTFNELDQQLKNVNPAAWKEVKQAGTKRIIQDTNSPATQK